MGLTDRTEVMCGNFMADRIGERYDLILALNVMLFAKGRMEELLKKREQEGIVEGERRFGELALKLSETGREKEIIEAASNPKLRQALYREFGL